MAQSADNSPGDNEKAKPEAAETQGANPLDKNLPMVLAPKLGAGEDEAFEETPSEPESEVHASATAVPSTRFLALAASVAFAAAFGSFVGSVSGSGLARFVYAEPAPAPVAASSEASADTLAGGEAAARRTVGDQSQSRFRVAQFHQPIRQARRPAR